MSIKHQVEINQLTARVEALERKVNRLGAHEEVKPKRKRGPNKVKLVKVEHAQVEGAEVEGAENV